MCKQARAVAWYHVGAQQSPVKKNASDFSIRFQTFNFIFLVIFDRLEHPQAQTMARACAPTI